MSSTVIKTCYDTIIFIILIKLAMLKRRRRIAKHVAALSRKKRALTAADVDRLKL
jgi:hypothetical protein